MKKQTTGATAPVRDISVEEMSKRVARFRDLTPGRMPFIDTCLPGHARELFNIIGPGVSEDPSMPVAIKAADGFNIGYVRNKPGERVGLHAHDTVEVFVPLTGRWTFMWGDHGERSITLDAFDVISIPPGVMRAFRNDSDSEALLMGITGGTDSGKVHWAEDVLEQAAALGKGLDEKGNVVRLDPSKSRSSETR